MVRKIDTPNRANVDSLTEARVSRPRAMGPAQFLSESVHDDEQMLRLLTGTCATLILHADPISAQAGFDFEMRDGSVLLGVIPMAVTITDPAECMRVISAAEHSCLSVGERTVYTNLFIYQKRMVYFDADRVVAQIYIASDNDAVQIEIGEPAIEWRLQGVAFGLGDAASRDRSPHGGGFLH